MRKPITAGLLVAATGAHAAPSADTPLAREWDGYLRGKKLTQLSSYSSGTSGGYNARQVAYLCGDGRFFYRSSSSVSVYGDTGGVGSAGGTEQHTGRWRVVSEGDIAALEVHVDGGESGYLTLAYVNGETYIDGERVFVTADNDVC